MRIRTANRRRRRMRNLRPGWPARVAEELTNAIAATVGAAIEAAYNEEEESGRLAAMFASMSSSPFAMRPLYHR